MSVHTTNKQSRLNSRVVNTIALLKYVVRAFISKNTVFSAIIFSCIAYLFSQFFAVAVSMHMLVFGIELACALSAYFTAESWTRTDSWKAIILTPNKPRLMLVALTFAVTLVVVSEILIPITVFTVSSMDFPHAGEGWAYLHVAVLAVLVTCIACILLAVRLLFLKTVWEYSILLLMGMLLMLPMILQRYQVQHMVFDSVLLLASIATICFAMALPCSNIMCLSSRQTAVLTSTSKPRSIVQKLIGHSLVLGELRTSTSAQLNTIVSALFMGFFAFVTSQSAMQIPLAFMLIGINSPLTTIISRNKDSQRLLAMLPHAPVLWVRYWSDLFLICVLTCIPQYVVYAILLPTPIAVIYIIASLVICMQNAGISVALDVGKPLHNWKTEREVLKSSRKFVASLVTVIELGMLSFFF